MIRIYATCCNSATIAISGRSHASAGCHVKLRLGMCRAASMVAWPILWARQDYGSFEQCFGGPQKLPPGGFLPHKMPNASPPSNQLPTPSKATAPPHPRHGLLRGPHNIPGFKEGPRGCAPLMVRDSTHGCKSWWSSHRCDPAAPESCGCRRPAPADVWRMNGGSCGRWLAC